MTGFRVRDLTATNPGKLRSVNEDFFVARAADGLWAVADGMGGHENGQWASRAIVIALEGATLAQGFDADADAVAAAIHAANAAICAESRSAGARMGSTAVALLLVEQAFAIFWVGDSRAYVLRGGRLHRLTQDHSQVQAMVDAGRLTPDEAANHPMSNVLVRAVGVDDELQLDAITDEAAPGDIFLLCSDGLTDVVSDGEIEAELARSPAAADRLIELCLERGAPDNVTVLTVACEPVTKVALPGAGPVTDDPPDPPPPDKPRPDPTVFSPADKPAADPPGPEQGEPQPPAAAGWPDLDAPGEPEPAAPSGWPEMQDPAPPEAPASASWPEIDSPAPAAPAPPPRDQPRPDPTVFAPAPSPGRIASGALLNNIYQVTRFVGRGGMGEVYEGLNVNTDERVAIKVILPSLAADPNVRALFREEARTLTNLHHPAVVRYRVLAQEPVLNILYIVTEFIDGHSLSDLMGKIRPSVTELIALMRRLAEGLGAAHALNPPVVHRDMSPDNVLLPGGGLDQAKIIDFGIGKSLDPGKATIIGDGFAGKLGFVAPEQFGDYGREIGPWTDVYSLALVILALAQGRAADMGVTLVEAVDRRRAGVDLSEAPEPLRSILARMLEADPARRVRSMGEVIALVDQVGAAPAPKPGPQPRPKPEPKPRSDKPSKAPLYLVLAGVVVVILAGGAWMFLRPGGTPAEIAGERPSEQAAAQAPAAEAPAAAAASAPAAPAEPPATVARRAIEAALPGIGCSWLDLVDVNQQGGGVGVRLAGVAGAPASVQNAVSGAASQAGAAVSDINLEEVAPVGDAVCQPLDAVRPIREASAGIGRLSTSQRKFEMSVLPSGKLAAVAVINMNGLNTAADFTLLGIEPTGKIDMVFANRAEFDRIKAQYAGVQGAPIADLGGGSYRLNIQTDHQGWSGMLLLTGQGPFPKVLLIGGPADRGPRWLDRFRAAAEARGWRADMVWYRTVDEVKG